MAVSTRLDSIALRSAAWRSTARPASSLGYILLPMLFVTWLAFFAQEIPSFPPEGYSLQWFRAVPDNDSFVTGFLLSLRGRRDRDRHRPRCSALPAALGLARGAFCGREAVEQRCC